MSLIDTQFIDIQWLKMYGLGRNNVLDYFYTSPFFDLTSNNELIRTQGVQPEHLINMTGLEYALDTDIPDQPNLFVIRKQYRESPRKVQLLDVYYCLDGIIYQSPELLQLIRSRINKTSHYLVTSFQLLQNSTTYSTRRGRICWSQEVEEEGQEETHRKDDKKSDEAHELKVDDADGGIAAGSVVVSDGAAAVTSGVAAPATGTRTSTVTIREFPSFSRVIADLKKSF
jgi:MED6 mediator sub complex component